MPGRAFFGVCLLGLPTLFCVGCGDASLPEGHSDKPHYQSTDTILGGDAINTLPAVGALVEDGDPFCTATLIGKRRVLTAAHCLEDIDDLSAIAFVIGPDAFNPKNGSGLIAAEMHPDYDPDWVENDLGIVTLAQDISTKPIGVIDGSSDAWMNDELLFVGYGDSEEEYGRKHAVWMPIWGVDDTTFWFGDEQTNICDGDSGGPAFFEGSDGTLRIAGVSSLGDENCTDYGIDTRVDQYLDFLEVDPACEGESYFGRCDGNKLIWCDEDGRQEETCDKVCGLDGDNGFNCLDKAPSGCGAETYFGRCDGDTLVWCEDGKVIRTDCDTCGIEGPTGFNCL